MQQTEEVWCSPPVPVPAGENSLHHPPANGVAFAAEEQRSVLHCWSQLEAAGVT